jgi:superfamily II RNA helicase
MAVSGYEIQAAQLYYTRCFDKLSPEKICVLLGAVIYEQRKKNAIDVVISDDSVKVIRKLREREIKFGIKNPIAPLDFSCTDATLAWVSGCDLKKIGTFGLPEGDIIRHFRMIVQLLRAVKASIDDPVVIEKLNEATRLINRDAVDAEAELGVEIKSIGI